MCAIVDCEIDMCAIGLVVSELNEKADRHKLSLSLI